MNKVLFYLLLLFFSLGLINVFFKEELKGELSGEIIFTNEKIQIADKTFILDDIRLIKFSGFDYVDQPIIYNFPDGLFSNGVNNKLVIILHSGAVISTRFQRKYPNEMRKISKQLAYYYNSKKIIKQNYLDTLNERIF